MYFMDEEYDYQSNYMNNEQKEEISKEFNNSELDRSIKSSLDNFNNSIKNIKNENENVKEEVKTKKRKNIHKRRNIFGDSYKKQENKNENNFSRKESIKSSIKNDDFSQNNTIVQEDMSKIKIIVSNRNSINNPIDKSNNFSEIVKIQSAWRGHFVREYIYETVYLIYLYQNFCKKLNKIIIKKIWQKMFEAKNNSNTFVLKFYLYKWLNVIQNIKIMNLRKNMLRYVINNMFRKYKYYLFTKYFNNWKYNIFEKRKNDLMKIIYNIFEFKKKNKNDSIIEIIIKWRILIVINKIGSINNENVINQIEKMYDIIYTHSQS